MSQQNEPTATQHKLHEPKCQVCGHTTDTPPDEWRCQQAACISNNKSKCYQTTEGASNNKCVFCSKEFGAFTWKHHCYLCGMNACDDCTPKRRPVPAEWKWAKAESYRCCNKCFNFHPFPTDADLATLLVDTMDLEVSELVLSLDTVGDLVSDLGESVPIFGAAFKALGKMLKAISKVEQNREKCIGLARDMEPIFIVISKIQKHREDVDETGAKLLKKMEALFTSAHELFLLFTRDVPKAESQSILEFAWLRAKDFSKRTEDCENAIETINKRIDQIVSSWTLYEAWQASRSSRAMLAETLSPRASDAISPTAAAELQTCKIDQYPPKLSCSTDVAVPRKQTMTDIGTAFQKERLVLLCGGHGSGKTVAAAQYCKLQKRKRVPVVQLPANALKESFKDLLSIPTELDKLSMLDIRHHMDKIFETSTSSHSSNILVFADDLDINDQQTVGDLVYLSKSPLATIIATAPTETIPTAVSSLDDCVVVKMTPFSLADVRELAKKIFEIDDDDDDATSTGEEASNSKLKDILVGGGEAGGGDDAIDTSLQSLFDACQGKPFLIHRALERFEAERQSTPTNSDGTDTMTMTSLTDFVSSNFVLSSSSSSSSPTAASSSSYDRTLESICQLQIQAFRKAFQFDNTVSDHDNDNRSSTSKNLSPLERLLSACKKLHLQEFDMEFLRLVFQTETSSADKILFKWIKWMSANVGLVQNLAAQTFSLHYLQSTGAPFDGCLDWEHAAVVARWKNAPATSLDIVSQWILGEMETSSFYGDEDNNNNEDKLVTSFCIVARSCKTFSSTPKKAPVAQALGLWRHLVASVWSCGGNNNNNNQKYPSGASACTIGRAAVQLAEFFATHLRMSSEAVEICEAVLKFDLGGNKSNSAGGGGSSSSAVVVRARCLNIYGFSKCSTAKTGQDKETIIASLVESVELYKKLNPAGTDNAELANALNDYGIILCRIAGKVDEGIALMKEAFEMRRRLSSSSSSASSSAKPEEKNDDADVAESLANLGGVYAQLGQHQEAVRFQTESFEMLRRIHRGTDNRHLANMLSTVADTLKLAGKLDESYKLKIEGIEMMLRMYGGGDDPNLIKPLFELASVKAATSKRGEALQHVRTAVEMVRSLNKKRSKEFTDSVVAASLSQAAGFLQKHKLCDEDPSEYIQLHEEALNILKNEMKNNQKQKQTNLIGMMLTVAAAKCKESAAAPSSSAFLWRDEGLALVDEAVTLAKKQRAESKLNDADFSCIMNNAGTALNNLSSSPIFVEQRAAEYFETSLEIFRKVLEERNISNKPEGQSELVVVIWNVAVTLGKLKHDPEKVKRAYTLAQEAFSIDQKLLEGAAGGEDNMDLLEARAKFLPFQIAAKKFDDALELLDRVWKTIHRIFEANKNSNRVNYANMVKNFSSIICDACTSSSSSSSSPSPSSSSSSPQRASSSYPRHIIACEDERILAKALALAQQAIRICDDEAKNAAAKNKQQDSSSREFDAISSEALRLTVSLQIAMQRAAASKVVTKICRAETYENQRFYPFKGWTNMLLPTDRWEWSDITGKQNLPKETVSAEKNREWVGDWHIFIEEGKTDAEGWEYARDFPASYEGNEFFGSCVRRRIHYRMYKTFEEEQK